MLGLRLDPLFFGMYSNELFAAIGNFLDNRLYVTILVAPLSYFFDHIHRNVDCLSLSFDLGGQKMAGVFPAFFRTPTVWVTASSLDLHKRPNNKRLRITQRCQLTTKPSF